MRYFLLIFLFIQLLSAGEKIALLIGNTDYKFQPLYNPINDVRAIKKTLIEIGFKKENVIVLENASRKEMINALSLFRNKASMAKIALVYFSGHGMQVNNSNYMFPANTKATTLLDIEKLVNLNSFIDSTTTAKYGIILIDACRNNPLTRNFRPNYKGGGIKRGLGQVKLELDHTVIGFATRAGSVADDGNNNNSPYAKALSENLKLNLDIRPILSQVGRDVFQATINNKVPQNPIYEDTLGRNSVCLTGKCKNSFQQIKNNNKEEDIEHKTMVGNEVYVEHNKLNKISNNSLFEYIISKNKYTWKNAFNYCQKLNLIDISWRSPKRDELKSLVKSDIYTFDTKKKWQRWFKKNYQFQRKPFHRTFWTAIPYSYNNNGVWFVNFEKGYEDWTDKNKLHSVICIRTK